MVTNYASAIFKIRFYTDLDQSHTKFPNIYTFLKAVIQRDKLVCSVSANVPFYEERHVDRQTVTYAQIMELDDTKERWVGPGDYFSV